MKSKLIVRLSLLTVIGAFSFNALVPAINASAATTKPSTEISSSPKSQIDAKEARATIEKYLVLNSDGTISLSKDVPSSYYKKYKLDKLEKHLAQINKKVANKEVSVNSDFSISNTGNTIGTMLDEDGGADYKEDYWWGDSVGFSYNSAKVQINDLNYAAEVGAGLATVGGTMGNVFVAIGGVVTGLYCKEMATEMQNVNDDNDEAGIVVDENWDMSYNVYSQ